MRIFGDAIDDKIFPKNHKRFTLEETNILQKFVNSILRNDKNSELESVNKDSYNDRLDHLTESLSFNMRFKNCNINLFFQKFYTNEKKTLDGHYSPEYSIYELIEDGYIGLRHGDEKKELLNDLLEEKSISGIFVQGSFSFTGANSMIFTLKQTNEDKNSRGYKFPLKDRQRDKLAMRTRYQSINGSHLTNKCKKHMEKHFLKLVNDAIIKSLKK